MSIQLQRGEIPVEIGGRTRILKFDHAATWLLIQKYRQRFVTELYKPGAQPGELELVSMDALVFFLWAGLQREAKLNGEAFTLADAEAAIDPFSYTNLFYAVVLALTNAMWTPAVKDSPGKLQAAGEPAAPAATEPEDGATPKATSARPPKGPGPLKTPMTRATTSSKRKDTR